MSSLDENGSAPADGFAANNDYALLVSWRWPNGKPECPECGNGQFYIISSRNQFRCKACRHTFSITSGTILHGIKVSAKTVITALQALNDNENASVMEIMRQTGMSYRGAHYLVARIRSHGWTQP